MIEQYGKNYEFSCDKCSMSEEMEAGSFNDAWADLKATGWRAYKDGDDWRHSCPACVEEWKKGPARARAGDRRG